MKGLKKINKGKYINKNIGDILSEYGYTYISGKYENAFSKLKCYDTDGYIVYVQMDKIENRKSSPIKFHKSNDETINNIIHFLALNKDQYPCEYVSGTYNNSKSVLKFRCLCGNYFYTSFQNVRFRHKIKCNKCSGYHNYSSYNDVKNTLKHVGYTLLIDESDFNGIINTDLICSDDDGYKYIITYDRAIKGEKSYKVHKHNPYSIYNINHYLFLNNVHSTCISTSYIDKKTILEFVCDKCGTHIFQTWGNTYRVGNTESRHVVLCPKCGGRTESLHACILKQLFKYYHPDTIEEEKSCLNPKTGKIMPTDIVNHRLKIAIEVQSEWHDNDYSRYKDSVKRNFWIKNGYLFYSPDIRDYSILEMCQIFFDIEEIPDFVNTEYSNKINVVQIQSMLNSNKSIPHIAKELNINIHRIYDAIYSGKIIKPSSYIKADRRPIVQLDRNGNYINEFDSIADASAYNGIASGTLVSALYRESHYSKGYFWFDKKDYYNKNIPDELICRFKNAS